MTGSLHFSAQPSNANLADPACQLNKDKWVPILGQFEANLEAVSAEGNDVSLTRHQGRGQLLRTWQHHPHASRFSHAPKVLT